MVVTPPAARRRSRRVGIVCALLAIAAAITAIGFPRAQAYWHWRQAQTAIRAEDFELSRAHLAICRRARPSNPDYAYEAARLARRDGDYKSARTHLNSARDLGRPREDILLEELLMAVQQSGWRGHDEAILGLLDRRPADAARIREVLAHAFFGDLLLVAAIEHANAWAEVEPWSGRAWQLIGEIKETARDQAGAMEAYRTAVERNPGLLRAQVGYADALFRKLQTNEAIEHYQSALAQNPRDRDARVGLVRAFVQNDRLLEAGPISTSLVDDYPQDAEVLGLAGRVALLDGRLADAEPLLTRSVAKVKSLVVLQDLQTTLARRGKVAEGRALEEQIATLREDFKRLDKLSESAQTSLDPGPRVEMGQIMIRNGLHREGLGWLMDAIRCSPNYRPAHTAVADYYDARGQKERAAYHRRRAEGR